MKQRFHGIISLALIFAAVILALIYIQHHSSGLGLIYLLVIVSSVPTILFFYCAKCTCKDGACSHVLPGMLTRFLPKRKWDVVTAPDFLESYTK